MKYWVFFLTFFIAISIFFCYRQLTSVSIPSNEQPQANQPNQPNPIKTPRQSKFEWIRLSEMFSPMNPDEMLDSLEIGSYKINKITVRKRYDKESPITDIYDAILTKKRKTIARFEGNYYPAGNFINFGLYPVLGTSEKQLLILDLSMKYERTWIVDLNPTYKLLFDGGEYDMWWGTLEVSDVNGDGINEIAIGRIIDGFLFDGRHLPFVSVIFKYDFKTQKYLPATHIFTDVTLEFIDEVIKEFEADPNKHFSDLLEIFMTYQYAGQEQKAWEFFDKNFSTQTLNFGEEKHKVNTKEKLKIALQKDMIYKFV